MHFNIQITNMYKSPDAVHWVTSNHKIIIYRMILPINHYPNVDVLSYY